MEHKRENTKEINQEIEEKDADKQPLVSVILVTYKKYDGIYTVLDSLFAQRYPNIELIIQDDGAFNFIQYCDKITQYIQENKGPNIRNVVINHLEENVGTSKNINAGISLAKGKYIKLLTADDGLFDNTVIESCVAYCEQHNARILVGQTYVKPRNGNSIHEVKDTMWYRWKARNGRMSTIVPSNQDISYLSSLTHEKCNDLLASRCIISTVSVFYRADIFEETKGFPEEYRYVEDMPFWPYLAKRGEFFHFSHIIMMTYELNGISNGGELRGEFLREACDIMRTLYIPNEVRGGILNAWIKKERLREQDYMEHSDMFEKKDYIKYMDVIIYKVVMHIKYLLLGTKL